MFELLAALSVAALLQAADAPRHAIDEGIVHVRAAVEEPGKPAVDTRLDVYVRGAERVLCVFREGPQAGRRVLMVGDRVWLIVPGTKHAISLSANQRLLGGASIGDVARLRFAEEFTATLEPGEERIDEVPCRRLRLAAKTRRAAYAAGTLWIGAADDLPRRARLALRSGKEAKELRFLEFGRDHGKVVLQRMEIRHLLAAERGQVTRLEFTGYEPATLAPELFDPQRARELP
ncbi:MAG TPA: outer membrane lipoprotein-sorting protein [Candidatus Polarisedimenticolaceae bacterium]|nr:outer membrane lipoprotein-sorting protein [Candidatus Polarisedimenticolaceae bacterium]